MGEELKEKLFLDNSSGWKNMDNNQKQKIFDFSNNYMKFLNKSNLIIPIHCKFGRSKGLQQPRSRRSREV